MSLISRILFPAMILPFLLPLKIGMNIGPERAGEERGQGAVERGRES